MFAGGKGQERTCGGGSGGRRDTGQACGLPLKRRVKKKAAWKIPPSDSAYVSAEGQGLGEILGVVSERHGDWEVGGLHGVAGGGGVAGRSPYCGSRSGDFSCAPAWAGSTDGRRISEVARDGGKERLDRQQGWSDAGSTYSSPPLSSCVPVSLSPSTPPLRVVEKDHVKDKAAQDGVAVLRGDDKALPTLGRRVEVLVGETGRSAGGEAGSMPGSVYTGVITRRLSGGRFQVSRVVSARRAAVLWCQIGFDSAKIYVSVSRMPCYTVVFLTT